MSCYLFDILHPAHVHFFRNAIAELQTAGHRVLVTTRDKDITLRLLELYGIPNRVISREASSRAGLARELLTRNAHLARVVLRERPDAMASIGGISTAQVGFLTRTRNYVFYDTENARLSNAMSYPLATEVVTPSCYQGRVIGKHVTYPGYHELAYLHPSRFTPDAEVIRAAGISPDEPYSVVRFVSWKAMHDIRARGFSLAAKRELVETLEGHGRVFITSEAPLPPEFEPLRLALPPHQVHHLLAFAHLFIGESATMASESVVLGTPAIYVDPVGRGYTDEQEDRYQLCFNYQPTQSRAAIRRASFILSGNLKGTESFRARVECMLSEKTDVTSVILAKMRG